jgi:hypothetical protein
MVNDSKGKKKRKKRRGNSLLKLEKVIHHFIVYSVGRDKCGNLSCQRFMGLIISSPFSYLLICIFANVSHGKILL